MRIRTCIGICLSVVSILVITASCSRDKVDFSAEVKPILNKRCIACHGGVKKNGGFSVLFRHEAIDTTESGKPSIVPGHPELSEVVRRINSKDPEVRMPYKEDPLTREEIDILTRWIEEGAEWGEHWAYQPPQPVEVPKDNTVLSSFETPEGEWARNDIDYFILEKLKEENLQPSSQADKGTLLRRVYLDVIGLPPTPAQAEKFLSDADPKAYEKLVDELLASPHFGEKWASWWLDLARYSDTKGYERDGERTIWKYRDWVIKAFNKDMPFDQFTIEQLAGDLLPNPSDDQYIATGFHRNTMNNDEGGTDDEEFRIAAVVDRVSTTFEVWQSTTFSCIQCHSHPYDPFVHEDYYKAFAFFNNTRDEDVDGEYPNLRTYKEEDAKKLDAIRTWVSKYATPEKGDEVQFFLKTLEPKYHPHAFDQFDNGELIDGKWLGLRAPGSGRLKNINLDNKAFLVIDYFTGTEGGTLQIRTDKVDGDLIASVKLKKPKDHVAIAIPLKPTSGTHDLYFLADNPSLRGKKTAVAGIEWFAFREALPGHQQNNYSEIEKSFVQLLNAGVENTPILIENSKEQWRTTRVFERGNWLTQGEEVQPATPEILGAFDITLPANRLGFAKWLVSKQNPLTSRTIVNRLWDQIFGHGIIETIEDFGSQGDLPTHPELLDWMALRFMDDHQWSMKKIIRDIVLSSAYQQDSRVTEELLEKDPSNRFYARGPRVRLSAEQVRDQALVVSGLFNPKMYGRGVMPYQPEGIWNSVWSGEYWKLSKDGEQHRRGIYTFHKRTSPYPAMMMFDGSSREVCVSRKIRTNTPLQALVTLNDSAFFETSVYLAKAMLKNASTPDDQIRHGYKRVLFREISNEKLSVLRNFYNETLSTYKKDPAALQKIIKDKSTTPETAAMILVANVLLNLDEVIMKE
jgi:hypothetical protein